MVGLLKALFSLISVLMKRLQKHEANRKNELEIQQQNKARAYENLQKAIKARIASRNSVTPHNVMSDDGYKRD